MSNLEILLFDQKNYLLQYCEYPNIDYFIDKLKSAQPYHFLRFNHGIIDSFVDGYDDYDILKKHIESKEYNTIAQTIFDGYKNSQWGFNYYNLQSETTIDKIKSFVKIFFEIKSYIPKLEVGISSGVGMGYIFGTYAPDYPIQINRNKVIKEIGSCFGKKDSYEVFKIWWSENKRDGSMLDLTGRINHNLRYYLNGWDYNSPFAEIRSNIVEAPFAGGSDNLKTKVGFNITNIRLGYEWDNGTAIFLDKKIGRSSFEKHYEYNFPNYFGIGFRFGILKGGTLRGY